MADPAVFWPTVFGLSFFAAGLLTYGRELRTAIPRETSGFVLLGPIFIAASLAAFAGEHFTAARSLAELVPKWIGAPLFITYFVGVAHLAAATSLVARRCVRWTGIFLAIMFGLFVALLWLPNAVTHPAIRMAWIVTVRETTFAMGGVALFVTAASGRRPKQWHRLASVARVWAGGVIIFYGLEHLLYPGYSPGVPDTKITAAWVPLPLLLANVTGILLIGFGVAMLTRKYASFGGAAAGLLLALLTVGLYVPEFFLARGAADKVIAINFVADTLLFSGTLLVITSATLLP